MVDIKVSYNKLGGNVFFFVEGIVLIEIFDKNKQLLGIVLDGKNYVVLEFVVNYDNEIGLVLSILIGDIVVQVELFSSKGFFLGFVEFYGYIIVDGEEKGIYLEMFFDFDNMVFEFVKVFNEVYRNGLIKSGD